MIKPEDRLAKMMAGTLAISSSLLGFLWLLLTLLFFGNFRLDNLWHCSVFTATMVTPFVTLGGLLTYLRSPTWRSFRLSLIGSAWTGAVWLLWCAPQSKGLIH